jgi:hypothetical protein
VSNKNITAKLEKRYARAAVFDAVKVLRNWVGHYAYNTRDRNATVGLSRATADFGCVAQ